MSRIISIVSMAIGTIGIFLGFWYLNDDRSLALLLVTVATVGITGILAFIRHVIFYKSDMRRLGMETGNPEWMFEVGFANLAFGFMGLAPLFIRGNTALMGIVLLGYAVYLFQAAMLHLNKYLTDPKRDPARLWRSVTGTLVYVVMMTVFGVYGLTH